MKKFLWLILLSTSLFTLWSVATANCSPDSCVAACSDTDNLLDDNFDLWECLDWCYSDLQDCVDADPCIDMIWEEYKNCRIEEKEKECNISNPNQKGYCKCIANWWIKLNTNIPFIGKCIRLWSEDEPIDTGAWATTVTQLTAFPTLMSALSNLLLSLILLVSLIMVISWWVMIASSGANSEGYTEGKKLIRRVVIGLIFLGASGIILAIINPNFFGTKQNASESSGWETKYGSVIEEGG